MNEIEELDAAYSNAKGNYLAAAHNEELARIAACDAHASRYDGSKSDLGVNAAIVARNSARFHMFNAARALDSAIDYKEKD